MKLSSPTFTEDVAASLLTEIRRLPSTIADPHELLAGTLTGLTAAWRAGIVKVVVDRNEQGSLLGFAAVVVYSSPLHVRDSMVAVFSPAPGRAKELLAYVIAVATIGGAGGVSIQMTPGRDSEAVDALVAAGLTPRAVVYGKSL